jgi:SAM-dependent methyltransferase
MEWISILKCPITGQALREMTLGEIEDLNLDISGGKRHQANGEALKFTVEKALINVDGSYIFPILRGILVLLKDLAIMDSARKMITNTLSVEKQQVRDFYDGQGWSQDEAGNYQDAVIYEDLREVSKDYIKKCHQRVIRSLNPSGTYMLDAASGALQFTDYLPYSAGYTYRVCVDLSFQALAEAKSKLGEKAICVLCDITNLPFKDGVMDGFVSMNTIYHIPKDEQALAVSELYRVLATGRRGVVVYDWFKHSAWMNLGLLPFRAFVFLRNRLLDGMKKIFGTKTIHRRLYFYAHPPAYFRKNLPPYKLKVWRSLSVQFMRYYIHPWLFGRQILEWVYNMEERNPEKCGLKGEYPMLVFEKE